jgi:acetylornithine deacetylase/succinyl-diaminopimelate desuccinylase-like protein
VLDVVVPYLPGGSREAVRHEIEEQVRRAAEADRRLREHPPTVEWSPPDFPVEYRPADQDAAHPAVQTLAEAVRVATGDDLQVGGGRGAITDAGELDAAGIPAVVRGPGDGHSIHRVDERVDPDDVLACPRALAVFPVRPCGVAEETEETHVV